MNYSLPKSVLVKFIECDDKIGPWFWLCPARASPSLPQSPEVSSAVSSQLLCVSSTTLLSLCSFVSYLFLWFHHFFCLISFLFNACNLHKAVHFSARTDRLYGYVVLLCQRFEIERAPFPTFVFMSLSLGFSQHWNRDFDNITADDSIKHWRDKLKIISSSDVCQPMLSHVSSTLSPRFDWAIRPSAMVITHTNMFTSLHHQIPADTTHSYGEWHLLLSINYISFTRARVREIRKSSRGVCVCDVR